MSDAASELRSKVQALREDFARRSDEVREAADVQALRDRFLGRKSGAVSALLKTLGQLAEEARKQAGQELNALKADLEARIEAIGARVLAQERASGLGRDRIDTTLPGRAPALGRRHPLTAVREELEDIFVAMGYEVYEGREVEDDYHCFEALNMPPGHPARDMQDTFYVAGADGIVLRTHTSSAQIRYMLESDHAPDVRIICPGKVYRRDNPDLTHSPVFHQVEALEAGAAGYLTKNIPLSELIHAVRAVHQGETIVPGRMLGPLLQGLIRRRREAVRDHRVAAAEQRVVQRLGPLRHQDEAHTL
jgi:phenylalanyl-tRNA synthetase alpha chain